MEGWLRLRGVDPDQLSSRSLLSCIHAALLEIGSSPFVPFDKVLGAVAESLMEPTVVRRETWGTGPAAEEGMRAMMDLVGGPAPLRDQ